MDGRISNPEHRLCEDIPRFCDGLADLLREWVNCAVDAAVFAYLLRSYSRSHRYTVAIMGYVFGAGVMTTLFAPNFGRLYARQQENEGMHHKGTDQHAIGSAACMHWMLRVACPSMLWCVCALTISCATTAGCMQD